MYKKGGSETLIGNTLDSMIKKGKLSREVKKKESMNFFFFIKQILTK